ncbi:transposase [Symbiopectobacterium sp. RP]|uniref:transposase n=1 Tax=Symbiopectobacterium sp. RP TaxID=3248553 RepID=UPI003D2C715B
MARYDLSDEAWAIIEPLLPTVLRSPRAGRPWAEHRKIFNGMFWILCSGAPWRDLPERYGPWKTVYIAKRVEKRGIKTVIPRKSNEKLVSDGRSQLDRDAYRRRNVVERCFGRLKEYRRIATRYEKMARNYLAMVKLGCIRLFYRRLRN